MLNAWGAPMLRQSSTLQKEVSPFENFQPSAPQLSSSSAETHYPTIPAVAPGQGFGHYLTPLPEDVGLQCKTKGPLAANLATKAEVFYSPTAETEASQGLGSQPSSPRVYSNSTNYPPLAADSKRSEPVTQATPESVVRSSRRSAWSKYIAYEACKRVCLRNLGKNPAAEVFLRDDCNVLETAFGLQHMFLKPQLSDPSGRETTILWDDTDDTPPDVSVIPVATQSNVTLRISPLQLKGGFAFLPSKAKKNGWFGGQDRDAATDNLYINLHRANTTADQGTWSVLDSSFHVQDAQVLDCNSASSDDDLVVRIHNYGEQVAYGHVNVRQLWEVANRGPRIDIDKPNSEFSQFNIWKNMFGCSSRFDNGPKPRLGHTWVEVFDTKTHRSHGQLQLAVWLVNPESPRIKAGFVHPSNLPQVNVTTQTKGILQISSWQVYDHVLDAAIASEGCSQKKLTIEGNWRWLLQQVADLYGIKATYTVLAHLRWVSRPEVRSCKAHCLKLLVQQLMAIKKSQAAGDLLPQEDTILVKILEVAETLVAQVFENYWVLYRDVQESSKAAEATPADIIPAVQLFQDILRDPNDPDDQNWLKDRIRVAATRLYQHLKFSAEQQSQSPAPKPEGAHHRRSSTAMTLTGYEKEESPMPADMSCIISYKQVESVCQAIQAELELDMRIQASEVLPSFLQLANVTAGEYCRELNQKLQETLTKFPPSTPTETAIDLLVVVGKLQDFMSRHKLLKGHSWPTVIDAHRVFGAFVKQWFVNSQDLLCQRVRMLSTLSYVVPRQDATRQIADQHPASPLVVEMGKRVREELCRYERVIAYWPTFAPFLELSMCVALRDIIAAVCKQCGLVRAGPERQADSPRFHPTSHMYHSDGSPYAPPSGGNGPSTTPSWQFETAIKNGLGMSRGTEDKLQLNETILLNSLRHLLEKIPELNETMGRWMGKWTMPPDSPARSSMQAQGKMQYPPPQHAQSPSPPAVECEDMPSVGAQFSEVVVELRTKYGASVTSVAERLSDVLFKAKGLSPRALLTHIGLTANQATVFQQVQPIFEGLDAMMVDLNRMLDQRVFVAVVRGLWDVTSRDLYVYVVSLQQSKENKVAWRGKQNATVVLSNADNFFKQVINRTLGASTSAKDLDMPYHSDKCHNLLADNTVNINMAYSVY